MKNEKEYDTILISKTVFDDTHRTILEKAPELLLPLINEVFRTDYGMDEPIVQLKNEHVNGSKRVITDSCLCIRNKRYHIESQSSVDGVIAVRMIEYDFSIALENIQKCGSTYEMTFPHSCVIYLRSEADMPDLLQVKVIFPNGQKALYEVPVVKVQAYTLQEIFEKGLVFFIPFYLMKYERELKSGGAADAYRKLIEEYDKICRELPEKIPLCPEGIKTDEGMYIYKVLMELVRDIVTYISRGWKEKERLVKHMGGQVLELEADQWWAELQEERKCMREAKKRVEEQEKRAKEQERQINYLNCLNRLHERLAEEGRIDDIIRAARDPVFRQELIQEYQCSQ